MAKKKIISFIDWYLPGFKAGGGQRAFSIMVSYLRDEFDFYIITRNTDFMETVPYEGIESNKWVKRAEGENVWYCPEDTISYKLFNKLLSEVNADYAYVNGVYSWRFSILPLILMKRSGFKGRVVVGTYGMLASTAINIKKSKKKLFLTLAKLTGLYNKVRFHATSENEAKDIKRIFGEKSDVVLAPHLPVKDLPAVKRIKKEPGDLKLVSLARISPEKNTLFALECLSEIGSFDGNIRFDLYGPIYDKEYWNECLKVIKQLPANIEVNYNGILDGNKVFDVLGGYHFLFMPTRGENFGYSILESFMAGRPVLISDRTPWRDLEAKRCGHDLSLEKGKGLFIDALLECLRMDQKIFEELSLNSRDESTNYLQNKEMVDNNKSLF